MTLDDTRILRRCEVLRVCGISRSLLYEMVDREEFPRPVRIGRRAVGWRADDIKGWLNSRPPATETNWR